MFEIDADDGARLLDTLHRHKITPVQAIIDFVLMAHAKDILAAAERETDGRDSALLVDYGEHLELAGQLIMVHDKETR